MINPTDRQIEISRVITHSYNHPRVRVFGAWLDPEQLVRWYHAGGGWHTPSAVVDAKAGGRFAIRFQSPDDKQGFDLTGTTTTSPRRSASSSRWTTAGR